MAHVLVHVAAGVIPEVAPVDVPVGVEIVRRRLSQERFPDDVFRRHVRIDGPGPLRLAMGRVAVHVGVDGGNFAHQLGLQKTGGVGNLAAGEPLVPDLDGALAGPLPRRAHLLGVLHGERHGFFLVDVLAGVERGHEVLAVQVLRGRDQHRVDALVFQEMAVVEVSLGVGRDLLERLPDAAYKRRRRRRIRRFRRPALHAGSRSRGPRGR